jgi:hypothetical protein
MTLIEDEDELIARFGNAYLPVFSDIPEHLQTQRVAAQWFTILSSLELDDAAYYWKQIPVELLTDDLRHVAVSLDARIIKLIEPVETSQYLDLFARAFKLTFQAAKWIHPDFQTSETIAVMLGSPVEFDRSCTANPWMVDVMTPDQLEAACRISARLMSKQPESKISETALCIHLSKGFFNYGHMRKEGKVRLAADFLKSGHWPAPAGVLEFYKRPPEDAADAFDLLQNAIAYDVVGLYMASLMNYPMEDVIALIGTREQVEVLLEMYSHDELRPYLKQNIHLKAALLEECLGL